MLHGITNQDFDLHATKQRLKQGENFFLCKEILQI
jgi:hypothetical protein